mmetsp:Transcript_17138/g.29497  ORF Transcript_17138/g.29497 Transcript_17138/m.29497 type:complete len:692 (-) Transcript_17138:128-2203(-)|eukprot:CAMPEP_0183709660 /NCGR_PEP_ID=MMETSP0737-20130205/5660_1 /TAXON_ID=385413 /ORGANISM="Thalassiosira miniscula, Strain CCMP1093" /LENGTH=691 /DNA_ID=CAMNT_0025937819 /DNA_START=86 /DNA_END=2161 /DNA_ORIENTATION=-
MAPLNPSTSTNANNIPPKPPRPFTEYHIFFQLERNYILQTSDKSSHIDVTRNFSEIDPDASTRPPRYRSLVLPKQWHTKGSRPKCRSHRKNHGKITFMELTKRISAQWKEADPITRSYCRNLAERELKRYRAEMKEYVERYGEKALSSKGAGGSGAGNAGKIGKRVKKGNAGAQQQPQAQGAGAKKAELMPDERVPLAPQSVPAVSARVPPPAQEFFCPPHASHPTSGGFPGAPHQQYQPTPEEHMMLRQLHQNQLVLSSKLHQMETFVKMQHQAQAAAQAQVAIVNPQWPYPQMMMMRMPCQVNMNGMMNSHQHQFSHCPNGNVNQRFTMTTVKDQGPLPSVREDEEYHDHKFLGFSGKNDTCDSHHVMDCNYDPGYTPRTQGCPINQDELDGEFGSFDFIPEEMPNAASVDDDFTIVGPIGIQSPAASPPPPSPLAVEGRNSQEEGGSDNLRAKSISPMPEYNIAPEISFLAKNFVNEFSRYLNHDHDVQKAELDAIQMDNDTRQGRPAYHQDMEKQMLNDMFHASQESGSDNKGVVQEGNDFKDRPSLAPKGKDWNDFSSGIGNGNRMASNIPCVPPFKGLDLEMKNKGSFGNNNMGKGYYCMDVSKPFKNINGNHHTPIKPKAATPCPQELYKLVKGQKEMFAHSPLPPLSPTKMTKQLFDGTSFPSDHAMITNCDSGRGNMQGWFD